jgi:hypothetical protein
MYLVRTCFWPILLGLWLTDLGCGPNKTGSQGRTEVLQIDDGEFEVEAIIIQGIDPGTGPRGSGSLSFTFTGDDSGSFSASGPLTTGQTDSAGVGAVINQIENPDLLLVEETFSLIAFRPTGDGKADVFIVGGPNAVDAFDPGLFYSIGPSGFFSTGLFLRGIEIPTFWAGQTNFLDTAQQAFVLHTGALFISTRDGAQLTGTFTGQTEAATNKVSPTILK